MDMLISIDPGLRMCGLARWEKGTLTRALLVRGEKKERGPVAWRSMAQAVIREAPEASRVVIEMPQFYTDRFRKGRPEDIAELAAVVGAISSSFSVPVTAVLPRTWKGQSPKDVTKERCLRSLTQLELDAIDLPAAKSLEHNVYDAIGLGLWAIQH
jgi:RNase H-fold protein (predicted Holliday junction resolvase)